MSNLLRYCFRFFFFFFFLYFLVAFTAERPEGKEEGVAHPQTKANPRRVRHRSCDAVMNGKKKKGEKEKERRTCSDSIAKAGLSLSLSPLLFTIAYYFVIVFLPYCISVPCWLACFFLFFFLEHFFFFLLGLPFGTFVFTFSFFFFKSPTPWIYWGRTEKWGSTDSFFFVCLFVS